MQWWEAKQQRIGLVRKGWIWMIWDLGGCQFATTSNYHKLFTPNIYSTPNYHKLSTLNYQLPIIYSKLGICNASAYDDCPRINMAAQAWITRCGMLATLIVSQNRLKKKIETGDLYNMLGIVGVETSVSSCFLQISLKSNHWLSSLMN